MKPGYQTTEHALTWAVVLLGAAALWRGGDSIDRLSALLAPAIASAAYSHSRARAKSNHPFSPATTSGQLASLLSEMFRGRFLR